MSVFEKIKLGLEEAIAYERGMVEAVEKRMSVSPVIHYQACEIKEIRTRAGMTQSMFAEFMGVSVKTVEAWESGRNRPIGSACRLLNLTEKDPSFPRRAGIVMYD